MCSLLSCSRQDAAMPGLLLGDVFPDFEANTTIGKIYFHQFLGNSWGILFSHPRDFTPVCTTELACAAKISDEFKKRDVKMIALSIDSVEDHRSWSEDVMALHPEHAGSLLPFPIIADDKRELSVLLGMLDPEEKDKDGMPLTARCVFVIGPDKRLKLSILYPATTGRNFTEILRAVDSLQLTAKKKVATPVNWKPGDEVMVIPSLSDEEAKKIFPAGFTTKEVPSGKKYLRYTPQP
ncbi:peroxiredoxin-6 [Electrophorus electricus]|uniref:Peroxiredoxin-6 n=1 Tax=Electrophorus electricus TaxID=8005 RepID=A0A4W4FHN4_ELEEL|nr:peroxiredoxin-6 [Electrophorus electricus]